MIREQTMKKYKVRIAGLGIEAVAIIPFDNEPDIEQVQNNINPWTTIVKQVLTNGVSK